MTNSRKEVIALDCDGPLIDDRARDWFDWLVMIGIVERQDYLEFVRETSIAVSAEEKLSVSQLYVDFRASDYFDGDVVTAGAKKAMRSLAGVSKAVVTARGQALAEETQHFLRASFGSEVFHDWHFGMGVKVDVVGSNGFDYFIEDSDDQAMAVAEQVHDIRVYLFPKRGIVRDRAMGMTFFLEAEMMNCREIDEADWKKVCECAWEQITDDILSRMMQVAET